MSRCFISFASEDQQVALEVVNALENLGVRCWICSRDIQPGEDYPKAILAGLAASTAFVLILSPHSNASPHVARELEAAADRQLAIFPLRIADVPPAPELAYFVQRLQYFDAFNGSLAERLREFAYCVLRSTAAGAGRTLSVERVRDPAAPVLLEALELYEERIPEHERFESPDIIRWLREDLEALHPGWQDYCYVARCGAEVVGFFLMHHYVQLRFAFIAYLVTARGASAESGSRVSQAILAEVRKLFAPAGELAGVRGILTEVDHPARAANREEWLERMGRIRLFCLLAESQALALRVLDFDYRQPKLTLDDAEARELPMVLLYSPVGRGHRRNQISRAEGRRILSFIYTHLYPEGFSDIDSENRRYRAYLQGFCKTQVAALPSAIPLMEYRQFKIRNRPPEKPAGENAGLS